MSSRCTSSPAGKTRIFDFYHFHSSLACISGKWPLKWLEPFKKGFSFPISQIYVPRKTKGPRVYSVLLIKSNQMNNLNPPFFSSRLFMSFFLETAWTTESFSNLFSPSQICAINLECNKTKLGTFLSNFIFIKQ
mgnify:FL=1